MDYAEFVDDIDVALGAAIVDDWLARATAPAVLWDGSVAATLALWLAVQIADRRDDVARPSAVFVDHGVHFDDVPGFVEAVANAWDVPLVTARHGTLADEAGPDVSVSLSSLADEDRRRLDGAGLADGPVSLDPRTPTGRLLLMAAPLHELVAEEGYDVLFEVRVSSELPGPDDRAVVEPSTTVTRVRPFEHIAERDVWRSVIRNDLPVNPLYSQGFRTVTSTVHADAPASLPAWEQVLGEETGGGTDRGTADGEADDDGVGRDEGGRSLMERLRDAGS